jgi:DNA replication and repair protein RecF
VGKTNLLESLHVATQGFSPRTRADGQLIQMGEESARIDLRGSRASVGVTLRVELSNAGAKRAWRDGAPLRAAEQLRQELATLVFTPDRLAVIKAGPAVRRAYFDRVLGRLFPARAALSSQYGAAVAQRNASLRRAAIGAAPKESIAPWTEQVVDLGTKLVAGREETLALLTPPFAAAADELGLLAVELRYVGEPPTDDVLAVRFDRDLDRGVTSIGPHLDDVLVASAGRDLRSFGSQGEQRLAVLALLLAEAELLLDRHGVPPLLLLDDVLSELDPGRRRILAGRVATFGQTLVTATDASALPVEPAQLLFVSPGEVRAG